MTRWLNSPEKTIPRPNKYRATLYKCKQIKNKSSLQEDATEPQGGDSLDFLLLPKLSRWTALSSIPFSKLRKGLLKEGSLPKGKPKVLPCLAHQSLNVPVDATTILRRDLRLTAKEQGPHLDQVTSINQEDYANATEVLFSLE